MKWIALLLLTATACCSETFKLYSNDGSKEWTATAFAVGPTTLITAAHTLQHTYKKGLGKTFILRDGKLEQVQVIKIDYDKDVCVLSSSENATYFMLATGSGAVEAVGFAGLSRDQTQVSGTIHKTGKWVEAKFSVPNGYSGGPLICNGIVAGMCANGTSGRTRFVPATVLSDFFKSP